MEIKLKQKQLQALTAIQVEREQLSKALNSVNEREVLIIELIIEPAGVEGIVSNLKLDGDTLLFDVQTELDNRLNQETEKPKRKTVK